MANQTKFEEIKKACLKNKEMSKSLIDEFLMYYTAKQYKLEKEMNKQFGRFRHITEKFPAGTTNMFRAQYIVHKLFKRGGLIRKVKNHSALKHLTDEEKSFLLHQENHPWRFSFSVIKSAPSEDFFEMVDVFTGENYLLYSPGVTDILDDYNPALWFNLIAFNGACYETYGVIAFYNGYEPGDILFFGQEIASHNRWIETNEDLAWNLENDPVPYMMLFAGALYPFTFHKEHQVVNCIADYTTNDFDPAAYKKDFKTEYNNGVYKLSPYKLSEHPHYCAAYFDEEEDCLFLSSLTDYGFEKLAQLLNKYGNDYNKKPDYRVNTSMMVITKDILNRDIEPFNRYELMFEIESSEEDQQQIDQINEAIRMMLPDINSGKKPDVEAISKKTGVDAKTLNDLVRDVLNRKK